MKEGTEWIGEGQAIRRITVHEGEDWIGVFEFHLNDKDEWCGGSVLFDVPALPEDTRSGRDVWQVESWEPLTISPSLLCTTCGNHGYIREGQWIPA